MTAVAPRVTVPPSRRAMVGAVALGGVVGGPLRYGLGQLVPVPEGAFPLSTFLINVSGSFVLGWLVGALGRRPSSHPLVRPFLGTGVLGAYTTFSTFAVEVVRLVDAGATATAATYASASLVVGIGAAVTGLALGGRSSGGPVVPT